MCDVCENTGLAAASPPSDELICLTFCPCEDGQRRRAEGVLGEVVHTAHLMMWCAICHNEGINSDGEFCGCAAGRARAAAAKQLARAPRAVETRPRQRRN